MKPWRRVDTNLEWLELHCKIVSFKLQIVFVKIFEKIINQRCQEKILDTSFHILYIVLGDFMENKISQGNLYDFYGEMLNEHQREVYEDFVLNDLSLGEIAADRGISRQAVHDSVKRSTKQLEEYEAKLHLIEKFVNIRDKVKRINTLCESDEANEWIEAKQEIETIANDILEEL